MNLRRGVAFYLGLVLVTIALTASASLVKNATVAEACSWSVEHTQTSGGTAFFSQYYQATDYLYGRITTYAGGAGTGCTGYKYYLSTQFTALATPGTYYTTVRVWVCSGYQGIWASASSGVASPSFHYGFCARQADNLNSYFHPTAGGANVVAYVTQG